MEYNSKDLKNIKNCKGYMNLLDNYLDDAIASLEKDASKSMTK